MVLDTSTGSHDALESAARRAGVRLEIAVQVSTPAMAWDLRPRGMGLLVVPRSLAPDGGSESAVFSASGLYSSAPR